MALVADLTSLVPFAISVIGAIGGAFYARRRGLPDIDAKVKNASAQYAKVLKDQLDLANDELGVLRPRIDRDQARIEDLEAEVDRLEKRIVKLNLRIDELESYAPPPRPLARRRARAEGRDV